VKTGRALTAVWYGSGRGRWHPRSIVRRALSTALIPLSLAFGTSTATRRRRYATSPERVEQLPVPVVVVGNLTVGGSGKTPLVIALIEALRREGYRPGVVSRGYGGSDVRKGDAIAAVDPALPDAADRFGDEPVLIAVRTGAPVFVGRTRPEVGRALLAAHPEVDVILSDDGLQHYALARNFEIAVFDERGTGNGRLLPAGPLREPLTRLGEVDAIVLNGADTPLPELPDGVSPLKAPFRMELLPGDAYRVNDPSMVRPLQSFRGRRLTAAAGIGNPQRFFAMLRTLGLSFHRMPLEDHHRYRKNPFEWRNSEAVLMTEKDAVKCARFVEPRMWAVPITAHVDPRLVEAILANIGGSKVAAPGDIRTDDIETET
jgi:tetraacyldisaccharide 4'-kinase